MSRRTTVAALATAAWLVSGCGLSLDLDPRPPAAARDASGSPARDAGADAGGSMDAASPPRSDAAGPAPDATTTRDAGPDDAGRLMPADGMVMCMEPTTELLEDCRLATPSPGRDTDGDFLPDATDPFPDTCNALVSKQEMAGSVPEWMEIRAWDFACGAATSSNASFTRADPVPLPDSHFAEATFTLGAPTAGLWAVGLEVGVTSDASAGCLIVSDMGGVVRLIGTVPAATHLGLVPATDGTTMTVQAWREGTTLWCRYIVGAAYHSFSLPGGAPTAVGTVLFGTSGRTVTVDYVRAFSL